jgi:hypothetical protein
MPRRGHAERDGDIEKAEQIKAEREPCLQAAASKGGGEQDAAHDADEYTGLRPRVFGGGEAVPQFKFLRKVSTGDRDAIRKLRRIASALNA